MRYLLRELRWACIWLVMAAHSIVRLMLAGDDPATASHILYGASAVYFLLFFQEELDGLK